MSKDWNGDKSDGLEQRENDLPSLDDPFASFRFTSSGFVRYCVR